MKHLTGYGGERDIFSACLPDPSQHPTGYRNPDVKNAEVIHPEDRKKTPSRHRFRRIFAKTEKQEKRTRHRDLQEAKAAVFEGKKVPGAKTGVLTLFPGNGRVVSQNPGGNL
jgi:hypothetical protein